MGSVPEGVQYDRGGNYYSRSYRPRRPGERSFKNSPEQMPRELVTASKDPLTLLINAHTHTYKEPNTTNAQSRLGMGGPLRPGGGGRGAGYPAPPDNFEDAVKFGSGKGSRERAPQPRLSPVPTPNVVRPGRWGERLQNPGDVGTMDFIDSNNDNRDDRYQANPNPGTHPMPTMHYGMLSGRQRR